jgi:hypothetical protein
VRPPLPTSARRKLARGIEQIQTLRGEAEEFENAEAYVFRVERERRSANDVKYRCFARERQPPADHWPLLAGEAIQNLRSALDHALYEVAPKRKRGRATYPIFTDPCEFQVIGLKRLLGIPAEIRAAIEDTQPYRRLPQAPAKDALEQLRTLSNIDKHRALTTFASVIYLESVSAWGDLEIRWEDGAPGKQLSHGGETYISTFVVTSETGLDEMDVTPDFGYQIRIEGRPLDLFPIMARRVFEGVSVCESGGKLPPSSSYPL